MRFPSRKRCRPLFASCCWPGRPSLRFECRRLASRTARAPVAAVWAGRLPHRALFAGVAGSSRGSGACPKRRGRDMMLRCHGLLTASGTNKWVSPSELHVFRRSGGNAFKKRSTRRHGRVTACGAIPGCNERSPRRRRRPEVRRRTQPRARLSIWQTSVSL